VADLDMQELLELLGQEQACYTALLDLSRIQRDLIAHRSVDEVMGIFDQKQVVLGRIQRVEEEMGAFNQDWESVLHTLDADDRHVIDCALSDILEMVEELKSLESESLHMLDAHG
jgi:hypothetical protein